MKNAVSTFSGFSVDNLAKATVFYTEILGLKQVEEAMGLALELPGGSRLFIYEKPDHVPATFTVLNFVVNNIDEAIEELLSKGIQMERYDNLGIPGVNVEQDEKGVLRGLAAGMGPDIAWFKDPAANVLSILQDKP